MLYILNAFSLGMLPDSKESFLRVREVSAETASNIIKFMGVAGLTSAVGHQATASVLSKLLGVEIPFNRIQVKLEKKDVALVFQLLTRLEEGRVLTEEEIRSLGYRFYIVEVL
jgi:hypothetical protein